MIKYVSIVEIDMEIHTAKTEMMKLVVEIECVRMNADEFDKETGPSDGLQPKQVDLSCVHALNELICVKFMLSQVSMKLINIRCVKIPNQFDIGHKFAPFRRKSIQKLYVHLKLFQFHVVNVHVIEE
nr:hypothetical protein [Tanacetum cinerariifolium]